jgi:tetratricopeptide (TPR) repeat protein
MSSPVLDIIIVNLRARLPAGLVVLACAVSTLGISLGLGLALPGVAQAQGKPRRSSSAEADRVARAEAAFKRGGAAFDAGKLDTALAHYQESYALWPRPRTLLNLGVVLRKLGRVAEAANLLAEYLEHEAADAARVDAVRRTLAELDGEVGRLQITAVGSGAIALDGKEIEAAQLARPFRVSVGRHRLTQDGDAVEIAISQGQELPIEVGRARPAEVTPPPAAPVVVVEATPPAVEAHPSSRPRRWYLWTGAATVLAGGATGYLAFRLRGQQADLDDILAMPQMHEYAEAVDARDEAERTALYTNLGIGVTAAGLVATGVLFLLYDDGGEREQTARAARLRPLVSSSGRAVSLSLTGAW